MSTNQIVIKQASQISLTKHDCIGYGCLTLSLRIKTQIMMISYDCGPSEKDKELYSMEMGLMCYFLTLITLDGPSVLLPNIDESQSLTFTPLFYQGEPSAEPEYWCEVYQSE